MTTIRPTDYVLTGLLTLAAIGIGIENVNALAGPDLAHPLDTQTPLMIPVFVAAVLPILWRRRAVLPALAITLGVLTLSLVAFGWVTRCGFGLPLMGAYAYALARFGGAWPRQLLGWAGIGASTFVTLVKDTATGGLSTPTGIMDSAMPIAVALAASCYLAGLIVNALAKQRKVNSMPPAEPKLSLNRAG